MGYGEFPCATCRRMHSSRDSRIELDCQSIPAILRAKGRIWMKRRLYRRRRLYLPRLCAASLPCRPSHGIEWLRVRNSCIWPRIHGLISGHGPLADAMFWLPSDGRPNTWCGAAGEAQDSLGWPSQLDWHHLTHLGIGLSRLAATGLYRLPGHCQPSWCKQHVM